MKKKTKITVTALTGAQRTFDNYDDFAKCIGFWCNSGDERYYYEDDNIYYQMYKASSEIKATVSRVLGVLTIKIETYFE